MSNLKNKVEAILFSAGKKVNIEEVAKLANTSTSMAHQALNELREAYEGRNTSLKVVEEGNAWKIIVKDEFLPIVKKIVTETELTKTVMETLAVIAFKYPIKQSDLIKIRTNKAYDHLKELEEMGYITRQKHGRTKLIKLTQKFFEYFDLPEEKLKEQFKDFESIAKAIEAKEEEIERLREEQLKKAQEEKQKDEKIKQEIDLVDEEGHKVPLEIIEKSSDTTTSAEPLEPKEKLGTLEVVDVPPEEELERERRRIEEIKEEERKKQAEKKAVEVEKKIEDTEEQEQKGQEEPQGEARSAEGEKPTGIRLKPEQEEEVNKRVEEMLHPKEEQK
jgi:segregation and condensation protein B